MACTKYRKFINDFLDNEIDNMNELDLLSHLSSCEECKIYLSNITKIKSNIKESFLNTPHKKNIDLSKSIMNKINPSRTTYKKRASVKLVYKIATIILILSAILIAKYTQNGKNNFAMQEEERMVFEHLEKSQNSYVVNIAYSQGQ